MIYIHVTKHMATHTKNTQTITPSSNQPSLVLLSIQPYIYWVRDLT